MKNEWDNLTEEEKSQWNRVAEKHQRKLQILFDLRRDGCWLCKYVPESLGVLRFHLFASHGLPEEFLDLL